MNLLPRRLIRSVAEGVTIAFDALRSNKLRSALTVLGVVIGVTTVMAMASIVQGVRSQIMNSIEVAGPTTFYVMRFWSQTPVDPNNLPYEVRIRPVLRTSDVTAIRGEPAIRYAGLWVQLFERIEYQGARTQVMTIFAGDDHYMDVQGGTLLRGRFFTRSELSGDPVAVLEQEVANRLFGRIDPLGKVVRIGDKALTVIGIYVKPDNIFEPPTQEIGAIVPYQMARFNYRYDETNALFIIVKPRDGVTVDNAMDEVTVALRRSRGLRPGMPNTFDLIGQDKILETVNSLTSVFFLVMIALSGVGLLVGGIGVMAIMMVSVTSRTREIGIRMALGATRREILWQFLVEAATLTLVGGMLGILMGLAAGELLKRVMGLESAVPVWSAVVAVCVSVGIGLAFGVLPANRAARLDPVEALRYE
ncbi:MAG TPA: ABC transporter permease [Gemmatimonadales bacterium]|jgi:putative ABC transport system permease protein|nr:ABC transporter permease [Gemmatimonadales bacterium]